MDFTRLFDILPYQQYKYPQEVALCNLQNGVATPFSANQCITYIQQLSAGLLGLGLQNGNKVAILSSYNCAEWTITDLAVQQAGGIVVPIHATTSADECIYIFNHAQIKYCFVNNQDLYKKITDIQHQCPHLQGVFTFMPVANAPNWQQLFTQNANLLQQAELVKNAISPQQTATILYTSGTTGQPKGVMLSHANMVSNIKAVLSVIPLMHANKVLSFLPLSHVFERTVVYTYLAAGASVHFSMITQTEQNLKQVKPLYFTAVPRVLERMYEAIEKKGQKLKGIQRRLFWWALQVAEQYPVSGNINFTYAVKLHIARLFVFNRLKQAVGGMVKGIILGAATLQPRLAQIFTAAGIPIREGYGLTECSPVLAFNRFEPGGSRLGTVGIPIPGVEIALAPTDGEILARGPNIMQGYYQEPELTQTVLSPDGWLHTGDLGEWVDDKFLKISGRKKELFKVSSGKYVAPQPIENRLRRNTLIEHALIIGDSKQYICALIAPAFDLLAGYCQAHNLPVDNQNRHNWLKLESTIEIYKNMIDEYNTQHATEHPIKKFLLLPVEFTPENGLLTPTFKVKREAVIELFKQQIEALYAY